MVHPVVAWSSLLAPSLIDREDEQLGQKQLDSSILPFGRFTRINCLKIKCSKWIGFFICRSTGCQTRAGVLDGAIRKPEPFSDLVSLECGEQDSVLLSPISSPM